MLMVLIHETIRNDDFERNTALQHCCDIVSDGYNIAPVKVMLHGTIRNDDFYCNATLQHCCDIVWNDSDIVPTLQRCLA